MAPERFNDLTPERIAEIADGHSGDEWDLWRVWALHGERGMWRRAIERAQRNRKDPEPARRALDELPEVTALQALSANHRLVQLIAGRRWIAIQDAREEGASWAEVGKAMDMSKQAAQEWHRKKIRLQEQHVGDLHDTARARAALNESASQAKPSS
jgi:hypothetical protein